MTSINTNPEKRHSVCLLGKIIFFSLRINFLYLVAAKVLSFNPIYNEVPFRIFKTYQIDHKQSILVYTVCLHCLCLLGKIIFSSLRIKLLYFVAAKVLSFNPIDNEVPYRIFKIFRIFKTY